jgi:hypothetical protein
MAQREVFIAAASGGRARVARIYASPCSEATPRYAAVQSCQAAAGAQLFGAGGGETSEWRRRIVGAVADSEPRSESCAQLAPSHAPRGQGLDRVRRIKKHTPPNENLV